eukprot:857937-Amphidinium_carterae.1
MSKNIFPERETKSTPWGTALWRATLLRSKSKNDTGAMQVWCQSKQTDKQTQVTSKCENVHSETKLTPLKLCIRSCELLIFSCETFIGSALLNCFSILANRSDSSQLPPGPQKK